MGLSHKKAQTVCYKADPQEQRKWVTERLPRLMKKAITEGAKILWQDEATFQIWVGNGYSWGERGKELEAAISLDKGKQKIYGVIELQSGKLTYSFSKKKHGDGHEFLDYLKYLLTRYKGTKIYVVIDNGPIHQGTQITQFLKENQDRIELERLPAYSPKFNPIEKVWKKMKNKSFHNRYFKNEKMLIKTLRNCLKYYQENVDQVLSVMKKWRKLYQQIEKSMVQGI
jgi:transposase